MKVFHIGAAGGIGVRLARLLTARGDNVLGMHRRPEQAELIAASGAVPVQADLIEDDTSRLATLMQGSDAVVFSAGAHGTGREQTTLIDGAGLQKASDAAERAGVTRFVLVSAFPESERGGTLSEGFEHYMAVKKEADIYLANTALDWLIVRPGLLTNDVGTGTVTASVAAPYGAVSRENVAGFIAAGLQEPRLRRLIVELVDGSTPIDDAVTELTRFTNH